MKQIKSVAFEWSADDVQRIIDNLSGVNQMIVNSRIDNQHEFLQDVIDSNKFAIIGFINDLIENAIDNEY
jgi:hypothetical protein